MAEQVPATAGQPSVSAVNESTAGCLTVPEPPSTPEHVRKYRRSYFAAAGQRVLHPGLIDDAKQLNPNAVHGVKTDPSQEKHVDDLMRMGPQTAHEEFVNAKDEAHYHTVQREPLGKSYSRGHKLPAHTTSRDFAFGVTTGSSEDAKQLLFPTVTEDDSQHHAQYLKSHSDFGPGEQRDRDYAWKSAGIDPKTHRFGVVDETAKLTNLVELCLKPGIDDAVDKTRITAKAVEDRKNTSDQLGRVRNLGFSSRNLPADHIFGVAGASDRWDARTCIQGAYSAAEQATDPDLGRSTTLGWRNVTTETRAFGCPSIRNDVEPPATRSVADNQNYGDDVPAEFLLYPPQFASLGIEDAEFVKPRTKAELFQLFEESGVKNADFEAAWANASVDGEMSSVEAFRQALNALEDTA